MVLVGTAVTVLVGDTVGAMVNVGVDMIGGTCPHAESRTKDNMQITDCNFRFLAFFILLHQDFGVEPAHNLIMVFARRVTLRK